MATHIKAPPKNANLHKRIEELEKENARLREAAHRAMVSAQDDESSDAYATLKKALEGGGDGLS